MIILFLLVLCLWLPGGAKPAVLKNCVVMKIHDGDTMKCKTPVGVVSVRLNRIDAPELQQRGGVDSRNFLRLQAAEGTVVTIVSHGRDKYGRIIGDVSTPETDLAEAQVRNGHAWVYRQYCKDLRWLKIEEAARTDRAGLWGSANPQPPWEYRKQH